jgi:uncharacterized MAPEG superfamily protein
MPLELSTDFSLLVWAVALCVVQMIIAVAGATLQVGLPTLAGNREPLADFTGWAGRATRAHRNMLESLVLFAALVLVAHVRRPRQRDDGIGRAAVLLGAPCLRARLSHRHSLGAYRHLDGIDGGPGPHLPAAGIGLRHDANGVGP